MSFENFTPPILVTETKNQVLPWPVYLARGTAAQYNTRRHNSNWGPRRGRGTSLLSYSLPVWTGGWASKCTGISFEVVFQTLLDSLIVGILSFSFSYWSMFIQLYLCSLELQFKRVVREVSQVCKTSVLRGSQTLSTHGYPGVHEKGKPLSLSHKVIKCNFHKVIKCREFDSDCSFIVFPWLLTPRP